MKSRRVARVVLGLLVTAMVAFGLFSDVAAKLRAGLSTPAAPTMVLVENRAVFSPLGVEVNLPLPWTRLELPRQPFPTIALRHPGGAAFLVLVTTEEPDTTVDRMLESTLADKRRHFPDVRDVARGREQVAGLPVRTLAFTLNGPNGPTRTKLWAGARGRYWLTFTCTAAAADFAHDETLCRQVLGGVTTRGDGADAR